MVNGNARPNKSPTMANSCVTRGTDRSWESHLPRNHTEEARHMFIGLDSPLVARCSTACKQGSSQARLDSRNWRERLKLSSVRGSDRPWIEKQQRKSRDRDGIGSICMHGKDEDGQKGRTATSALEGRRNSIGDWPRHVPGGTVHCLTSRGGTCSAPGLSFLVSSVRH